jgi:hypothetical protein
MPQEIVIRPAAPAEAAMLLDVMRRAFGEYHGVLKPESSVFVETPELIAAKLAGGGGFWPCKVKHRLAASLPRRRRIGPIWAGWRSIPDCAGKASRNG